MMSGKATIPFSELVEGPFFVRLADGAYERTALRQAQGRDVLGVIYDD